MFLRRSHFLALNFLILTLSLCLIGTMQPAWAQQAQMTQRSPQPGAGPDAPLEITADGSLEWDRDRQQMLAKGNAMARQGATSIAADTLAADYSQGSSQENGPGNEISRLTAQGNVRIQTIDSQAFGAYALYEVDKGTATLNGSDPQAQAKGVRAKVLHGGDTLESDSLIAFLKGKGPQGPKSLDRVETRGRVTITTPTERIEGDRGVYVAATRIATLTGNVRITRGQNVLEGHKAEVNLATNVSRLIGSDDPSGRVRGVFYPAKDNRTEE